MKTFEPKNKNLIEIFFDNVRYEVPRFQREYAWGIEQIKEFWSDIESVSKQDKDSIFFGNFIFLNKDAKGDTLAIIDGQQRLTTLQFLLIAIRTRAKQLRNEINDNVLQISSVNNLIEYYSTRFGNQESTGVKKVLVEKTIRPLFDIMSDYKWAGSIPEKIENLDGRKYRKIKRRIEPVYSFFFEKVKDLDSQGLTEVLNSLEKIFVTKIEIYDPTEAFDIFERTNARGVKLAQSDLVKNLLFQKTDEKIHDGIDKKWTEITVNSSDKLAQVLKYYVVTNHGKTLKKDIFPILSARVDDITPNVLIEEILDFSLFYKMMSEEGTESMEVMKAYFKHVKSSNILENDPHRKLISRSITAFKLFNITQVYPLIYSYIKCLIRLDGEIKQDEKRTVSDYLLRFLQRLENFHFINTVICGNIGNQVEQLYADFSKKFSVINDYELFKSEEQNLKKELMNLRESKKTFVAKFTELNYTEDDPNIIRYVFDRISNSDSKGAQIYPLYNPDKTSKTKECSIEHFYPKNKFESNRDLVGIESGNNIGNLLLIPSHSNSSFSDFLPLEKFKMINNDNKHLINIGNKNLLIMNYEGKDWDQKLIEERANQLGVYGFDNTWNLNL